MRLNIKNENFLKEIFRSWSNSTAGRVLALHIVNGDFILSTSYVALNTSRTDQ